MGEERTLGWDSIVEKFQKLYPGQEDVLHFGALIPYILGGNDPLDGISIYDGGDFYHFVTFGFSEVYEKESENLEYSGYGFELTLKLKKNPNIDDHELKCMAGVLQSLARYVFQSGAIFSPNEYIYTKQTTGMDSNGKSKITGFITTLDEAGEIDSPNGKVQFVQLIGMTDKELKCVFDKTSSVTEMYDKLTEKLTDFTRDDLI